MFGFSSSLFLFPPVSFLSFSLNSFPLIPVVPPPSFFLRPLPPPLSLQVAFCFLCELQCAEWALSWGASPRVMILEIHMFASLWNPPWPQRFEIASIYIFFVFFAFKVSHPITTFVSKAWIFRIWQSWSPVVNFHKSLKVFNQLFSFCNDV